MLLGPIFIRAKWANRKEDERACANRLASMFHRLADIDTVFDQWCCGADSREEANDPFCKMPPDLEEIETIFDAARRYRGTPRKVWPEQGFSLGAWTGRDEPYDANFGVVAGAFNDRTRVFANDVAICVSDQTLRDGQPWTPAQYRSMLFAAVECWDACYGTVSQGIMSTRLYPETGFDQISAKAGWMTYVAAPWGDLVRPPESIKTERFANGAMLATLCGEVFSVQNPDHMRLAREMRRALMPVQEAWKRPETAPW